MILAKDSDSVQMMDTDGPDIFNWVGGPLLVMGKCPLFLRLIIVIIILVLLFSLPRGTVVNTSIACELMP